MWMMGANHAHRQPVSPDAVVALAHNCDRDPTIDISTCPGV